ncbi:MAG: twin-arginine translocation pathway signal protein [Hyphomicrobiales bacterium]|nr:twin-arginine translocation pathway signal protein [Hyphomicrobiales bacterium]
MNRRKFLMLAGGGVVLAAGVGLGAVVTRTPHSALKPWADAGSLYKEPRKRALSYAILAPNPHNRQPWLVDLSKQDQVILTADTKRLLPHTDPFNRQITIGLGCFLEVMRMAAAEDGYRVDFDLFPEGESADALDARPIAIASFAKDAGVEPDPLFAHILQRRSLKEPYDLARQVPDGALAAIVAAAANGPTAGGSNSPESVERLRRLTHKALAVEIDTPRTYKESVDLFRIGKTEIEANPDGIDFSGPMFETLNLFGLMTREGSLDTTSSMYKQGRAAVLEATDTAMAHLWLVSPGNTRSDQINAGRDWVRINLAATGEGIGIQPLSQALQEYTEMKPHYDQIHKQLAPGGGTVQMLARLGYAAPVAPSPRWSLETKIVGS